jgi:thioredoxin-related protein
MKNLHRKVEMFSNIAIILIAFLLGGVVIYRYVLNDSPQPVAAENKPIKVGTKLDLPNADWDKSDKTLVMALSTNCRFCTESTPFYKKLAEKNANNENVRLVVVTPQDITEAKNYLEKHEVLVNRIKQSTLNKIQVSGTPTLILVDRNGKVLNSWVGKLPPEKETEVIKSLFG